MKKNILTFLFTVGLALLIVQFIQPTLVNGDSMYPYLDNGDYLLMNKTAYLQNDPEYGDVIVFPRDGVLLIKRVIGKPGDTIEIKNGNVYRNGTLINDYVDDVATEPEMTVVLNDDYFVLGDNRAVSLDSRYPEIGNVKKSEIKGKAFVRLFPNTGRI